MAAVETHVAAALERTEGGVKELEVAKTYVASYRRKWCFVITLLLVAAAVPLVLHFGVRPGTPGHI